MKISTLVENLDKFPEQKCFVKNEKFVQELLGSEPKDCSKFDLKKIKEVYYQAIEHLVEFSKSREICSNLVYELSDAPAHEGVMEFV